MSPTTTCGAAPTSRRSTARRRAIKTYPDAPANEEALFILVKAYDALGMNDLRDDADRVHAQELPEQRVLQGRLDESPGGSCGPPGGRLWH